MTEPDREDQRQSYEALQSEFFANRALIIAANRGPVTFEKAEDGTILIRAGRGRAGHGLDRPVPAHGCHLDRLHPDGSRR